MLVTSRCIRLPVWETKTSTSPPSRPPPSPSPPLPPPLASEPGSYHSQRQNTLHPFHSHRMGPPRIPIPNTLCQDGGPPPSFLSAVSFSSCVQCRSATVNFIRVRVYRLIATCHGDAPVGGGLGLPPKYLIISLTSKPHPLTFLNHLI